ncbi:hypothetical protein GPX89_29195 [Nocardia sp. ET3-3]|uniref:Acyl-CoA carboxylase subunit epsilon n=1 Tax=Nocardia terrae TaxID=2675851 RepID=A0A7K1V3W1_9NOCA|nr:hypothetical protein [Nocardia terrae]
MIEQSLVIERGNPDDLEIAAVITTLATMQIAPTTAGQRPAAVRWLRRERRTAYIASNSWAAA